MRNRPQALGVTVAAAFVFLVLFGITSPESETTEIEENAEDEEIEEEPEEADDVGVAEEEAEEEQENETTEQEAEENEEVDVSVDEEASEVEDTTWDDLKNQDNIVGKSDKDFSDVSTSDPTDVRNDTTGNWRKSTITENVKIEEYALSYQELHMEADEVHHIINFTNNTTTWLNNLGGLLYVDVKEYVDGEEHDAATLGSGMLLKSYIIYPDGDVEEIEV